MSSNSYLDQDEIKDKKGDLKSLLYLLQFAKPYRIRFTVAFSLLMSASILAIISARFLGKFVEEGLVDKNKQAAFLFAAFVLGLETVLIFMKWVGRRILAEASTRSILQIRKTLFNHIHQLPLSYYDRQPQGRTITRMTHDVESLEEFFTGSLGMFLNATLLFFMALAGMLLTNFRLGVILLLSMIPVAILTLRTRNRIRDLNRETSKRNSATNAKLSEYISGISVIRSMGLENWSLLKYGEVVDAHLALLLKSNNLYAWLRPMISLLCYFPMIALVWFGGKNVLAGTMGIGVFVTFIRYCEHFSNPIVILMREIHVVQAAFTSAERITVFLNAPTENHELGKNGEWAPLPHELKGEITFDKVTMGYHKDQSILNEVSFSIKSGEKIGLAGTTGSGKTTTVSLISRLYDYRQGNIYLDGKSLRDYDRKALRSAIGVVSQDVVIFAGSLRENLTLEHQVSDKMILDSCEQTGLLTVMKQNGLSLDSEILENGTNLSTGERQLVSLTRILLKNPAILILDEATANVDPHYEEIIHNAVNLIMQNRTCIMIAHRLMTLHNCDRIFVFHNGKIIEEGTHRELLSIQGHFYSLTQLGT